MEDFWTFWDKHSTADYEDFMEDVEVEAQPVTSRAYCAVAKDLLKRVRLEARHQGVSTGTLINIWLQEKVAQAAPGRRASAR